MEVPGTSGRTLAGRQTSAACVGLSPTSFNHISPPPLLTAFTRPNQAIPESPATSSSSTNKAYLTPKPHTTRSSCRRISPPYMAALRPSPVPGGGHAGGTLVARNGPPLCHVSNRNWKSRCSYSSLSSKLLTPAPAGVLRLQKGGRGFVDRRRPQLPPLLCFFGIGGAGSGSRRDDSTGVEDEDADIEELVIRSRGKLVIDVRPLQEARREEDEAVRKGKEMLFELFRLHIGVTPQELRAIWQTRGGGGGAEERLRLVRDFLEGDWGWRYRPLSPRAAVEMLDEHMGMGSLEGRAAAAAAAAVARPRRLLPNWWR